MEDMGLFHIHRIWRFNTQKVCTEGTKPFPIFSHQKPEFGIYVFVKGVWLSAPN